MGGICERRYRDSMASLTLQPGAQTGTHLDNERIAVVRSIALHPQYPCVDVRRQTPAAEDVGAESGVCPLGKAAIVPNLWEAREQQPARASHSTIASSGSHPRTRTTRWRALRAP